MTTLAITQPQTISTGVLALCTPNKYPEFLGQTTIEPIQNTLPTGCQNFITFFKILFTCAEMYFRSDDYKKSKADNEDDLTIFGIDPIEVMYMNGEKWFIKITLLTLNGFSKAQWQHQVLVRIERLSDEEHDDGSTIRKDTLMQIYVHVSIPELSGYFMTSILDHDGGMYNSLTESFTYKITNLRADFKITMKEIDEVYRKYNFRFRAPDLYFNYNLDDIKIHRSPRPQVPTETEESDPDENIMLRVLRDFIEQKMKWARDEIAQRMTRHIFIKITPYIVRKCKSEVDIGTVLRGAILNDYRRAPYIYPVDTTTPIKDNIEVLCENYRPTVDGKRYGSTGKFIKQFFSFPFASGMHVPFVEPTTEEFCSIFFYTFEEL